MMLIVVGIVQSKSVIVEHDYVGKWNMIDSENIDYNFHHKNGQI